MAAAAHVTPIGLRPPADFARSIARYERYGVDAANRVETVDGRLALVRCLPDAHGRLLGARLVPTGTVDAPGVRLETVRPHDDVTVQTVRRVLGDDWDLAALAALGEDDAALRTALTSVHGFRPALFPDAFEALVTAISAQQINLRFAFAVRSRLVLRYGRVVDGVQAFPAPADLAGADPAELRAMQFTERKSEYIVGLAREIVDGRLDLRLLEQAGDAEVIDRLIGVRGVGRWTAEWFLLRTLGRADALPAGDLAVRKVVAAAAGVGTLSEEETRAYAERWAPLRGLAILVLLEAASAEPSVAPLASRHARRVRAIRPDSRPDRRPS